MVAERESRGIKVCLATRWSCVATLVVCNSLRFLLLEPVGCLLSMIGLSSLPRSHDMNTFQWRPLRWVGNGGSAHLCWDVGSLYHCLHSELQFAVSERTRLLTCAQTVTSAWFTVWWRWHWRPHPLTPAGSLLLWKSIATGLRDIQLMEPTRSLIVVKGFDGFEGVHTEYKFQFVQVLTNV